ncbi:MAG: type II toxin-antitoxin system VapC family toxin [Candidatus Hydrogenedentes bacterium]|nr:type II toxin-antitoxin system VapC family toxin [Candidatus Hydrogenedentota bacterium]
MNPVFVDTSFYQAILNPRDHWHALALERSRQYKGPTITSEYVLCELGALMSAPPLRRLFAEFVQALHSSEHVEIVPASSREFSAGFALFSSRLDKHWSLTDCISFAIMEERKIHAALTFDRHFEQAGFRLA